MRHCEQPDCEGPHIARGLCEKHYRAWQRHGDPNGSSWWWGRSAEQRFWQRVRKTAQDECWLWLGATRGYAPYQYGTILVGGRPIGTHRFSYIHHRGDIPDGMEVCHSCDNTLCVNPGHLFLGTHSDNMRDMIAKGRADTRGARNGRAKLTPEDIATIRRESTGRHGEGMEFARRFGVTSATISKVIRGDTWSP